MLRQKASMAIKLTNLSTKIELEIINTFSIDPTCQNFMMTPLSKDTISHEIVNQPQIHSYQVELLILIIIV
jgi:hypothetical protein